MVEDANQVRGQWSMGKVQDTYPGRDGLVRDVEVMVVKPDGTKVLISRPIQKLAVIVPVDEKTD